MDSKKQEKNLELTEAMDKRKLFHTEATSLVLEFSSGGLRPAEVCAHGE